MKSLNSHTLIILTVVLISVVLCGCEEPAVHEAAEYPVYKDVRDIPGVTEDEIDAVKELKSQRSSFVYGTIPSTESFISADGEIKGFTVLLCDWLAELFDIPFEIRFYEWDDMLYGLETGEVDFTGELTATDERRDVYLMTEAIAGRSVKYMRIAGSAPLTYIAATRPPRFAFLRGTTTFEDVRVQMGDSASYFLVGGYEEAYLMLKDGDIDAFIDEGVAEAAFDAYGDVVTEDFYPLIYGPVSLTTQKAENEPIISVVQKALESDGIYYLSEQYNLGFYEYKRHKLNMSLTPEERMYIDNNPGVAFVAEYDNYPVSFYNAREDRWEGVCFDVLHEAEKLTGLVFERVNDDKLKWQTLIKMLEDGEASVITELIRTPEREGHFLWPDTTILTDYFTLVSKSEYDSVNINEVWLSRIGLVEGTAHMELFCTWFPNHLHTTTYASFDHAFTALRRGDVDMVMASRNLLLILTNYQELTGYKANIVFNYPFASTLGFHKGDELLCSIVEKALRLIDTKVIADDWTGRTYDYSGKLAQSRLPWLIGVIVLLLCLEGVLILLVALFYKSRKTERQAMEAEIREQALISDNATLDRLNRLKTEFFQNMSHDFKTPLTVISTDVLNATDMLDFEIDKDAMRTNLENAQREIMRMARMVDNAMKYTSVRDVRKNMEPLDTAKLLREGAETYHALLEQHGNVLSLEIPPSLPRVYGNADTLLQVLSNLLSNANRYTHNGEIGVCAENDDIMVSVTVRDNGEGVKPDMLSNIFLRGVSDSGTGLGLSICKSAVEAHNGTISIESEYGHGTAITFTLPIYKEEKYS